MSDIADEIVETLVAAPTNDQRAYVRDAIARELAQVSEVLKDYITQAKARDNGLSTSDLKPIFARYHRGEISEGRLIEEIRLAALATVDKLTARATKERDDARASLLVRVGDTTFKPLAESLSSLAVELKADRDLARAKLIEIIGCAEELGKTGRMAPMYFNAEDIEEMKKAAGLLCE